jgi:hypothetical protein
MGGKGGTLFHRSRVPEVPLVWHYTHGFPGRAELDYPLTPSAGRWSVACAHGFSDRLDGGALVGDPANADLAVWLAPADCRACRRDEGDGESPAD